MVDFVRGDVCVVFGPRWVEWVPRVVVYLRISVLDSLFFDYSYQVSFDLTFL